MQNPTELIGSSSSLASHYTAAPARREMTLHDLVTILSRRRNIILGTFLLIFIAAVVACATATRLYKSTAEVQIQKDTADALSLNSMIDSSGVAVDSAEFNMTLQTEAQILQSESLALSVINALKLENTPDFKPKFSLIGWVLGPFSPKGIADPKNVDLEDAPGRRARVVKTFESRLKVIPVSGTRLIDIEYLSSDPKTATAVVNLLVQNLMNYNFETRRAATQQASGWLTSQLADLRKHSEELQAKVVSLQRDSGVFTLGQTDSQGREQVYTPLLDRLQQATAHLTEAQSSRIMKGALNQVVKDGDPELISGLVGSSLSGASAGINSSLTLLQDLRTQAAQTQAMVDQLSAKFGPAYPKLVEEQASLQGIHNSIRDEANRIAARVSNDYAVSVQVENKDRDVFQQEKDEAESLNSKAIEYEIARQEALQSRTLYQTLLGRLKEADVVAGLHSSNITLVDPGRVPARPSKPNLLLYLAGGIGGGFFLGICAALLRDATDVRIQDLSDVDGFGNDAPLGYLPYYVSPKRVRQKKEDLSLSSLSSSSPASNPPGLKLMVAVAAPYAAYTEALRALRTSLMQNSHSGTPPQVVLITSSTPGEGKSMLSMNLAIVYAQGGKRVLLVDGDLRTPTLQAHLGMPPAKGLSSLLSPDSEDNGWLQPIHLSLDGARGFDVMPAGLPAAFPAELLASDEMAELVRSWRKEYDHIIIDGAPLLPVTDSALLSRYADFTLVVARHNMTDRRSLDRTCQILRSQGVRRAGVVLNAVKGRGNAQYGYYGHKQIANYGGNINA